MHNFAASFTTSTTTYKLKKRETIHLHVRYCVCFVILLTGLVWRYVYNVLYENQELIIKWGQINHDKGVNCHTMYCFAYIKIQTILNSWW